MKVGGYVQYIKMELRRAIKHYHFWLAFFLILLCFYYEHRSYFFDNIWKNLDAFYIFVIPFDYSLFFMIIPFAAILPCSLSIVDDIKTGYIRMLCYRGSRRKYVISKSAACGITSMVASLCACLVFLLFSVCVAPIQSATGDAWIALSNGKSYEVMAHTFYGLPYIFEITTRTCLTVLLWSIIGALISFQWKNKAITLASVFILFYATDFLLAYLGINDWRPFILFYSNLEYNGSILFRYIQNASLILISSIGCYFIAKKNLKSI